MIAMSHPDYSRRYRIRKVWGRAGILEDILGLLLNKAVGAGSYPSLFEIQIRPQDKIWFVYLSKEPIRVVPCIANVQLFWCLHSREIKKICFRDCFLWLKGLTNYQSSNMNVHISVYDIQLINLLWNTWPRLYNGTLT